MGADLPKPLFFWSLPVERSFADRCRELYPSFRVIPMHAEAVDAACDLFQENEIIRPGTLFCRDDILGAHEVSFKFEASLRKSLAGCTHPWLRSLDSFVTRPVVYGCLRIWAILNRLASEVDLGASSIYPSFSRHHLSFASVIEQNVLERSLDLRNAPVESGLRLLKRRFAKLTKLTSGAIINRHAPWFMRRATDFPRDDQASDVLVAGLLSTDLNSQRGLVKALRAQHNGRIAWYCYTDGVIDLSADEQAKSGDIDMMTRVNWRTAMEWRRSSYESWSRVHSIAELTNVIKQVSDPGSDLLIEHAEQLASLIVNSHEPLRKTYTAIEELFAPVKPSIVVAGCNCGSMAFVREWAREHHTPYIKLPHALEFGVEDEYEWDNQATGFLGRWLRDQVLLRFPGKTGLFAAGGVHIAEQARRDFQTVSTLPVSRTVCFLASETIMTDYPDNDEELHAELIELGKYLADMGYILSIRGHPRGRRRWFYRRVVNDAIKLGIQIDLSNSRHSLNEYLSTAAAVIMRITSSSAIITLYNQIPLIGWMPRPCLEGSDNFLRGLPLHGAHHRDVATMIHRVCTDLDYRMEILGKQQTFLAEVVEDPYGDPWQRSIDVILRELDKAKQRSNE